MEISPIKISIQDNQIIRRQQIRGILFDVDGTLYCQTLVRILMALLLILFNIHKPFQLFRKTKIIKAFRKSQEVLRTKAGSIDLSLDQIHITAQQTGESTTFISETIIEWFEQKSLPIIYLCRRRNLRQALQAMRDRGLKLGVYSDYPVHNKLKALKIADLFSVLVASSDSEVQSLKPHSKGFWIAAKKMRLHPSEIVYVGDRPHVDAVGGSAAGMKVIIVEGRSNKRMPHSNYQRCISLSHILETLG